LEEACYERDQIAGEVTATDPYHGSLVQISLLAELSAAEQAVRAAEAAVEEAAAACHEPFPGHGHLETRG
jgi:hypothetical protein